MHFDSSFLEYFIHASFMVKVVMLLLASASVFSWTYILQRGFYLSEVRDTTLKFEREFWSGVELSKLYEDSVRRKPNPQGMEAIFQAGFKEFSRSYKQIGVAPEFIMDNVKRAMNVAQMREQDKLELHLPTLATIGSTSPYVGLFGTVWGIMLSFQALAHVQQATISMVAPGIAEALIATAMGLFAAIPAVIAYNRYATTITRILNRFDSFQEEFSNIVCRQARLQPARATSETVEV